MKSTKEKLYNYSAVEVYKEVLKNNIKTFPKGFWQRPEAEQWAKEITKFLLEDILKWTKEDIKNNFSGKLLRKNKLSGMLSDIYNNSPFEALNSAYPEEFKPWEVGNVPRGFWTIQTGVEATKWLIEEKLKWSNEDIKEKISARIFRKHGLGSMLEGCFGNSPYKAINTTFPNRFKTWELPGVPRGFWDEETSIQAAKWLIEEKLKWNDDKIKEELSVHIFM